jgi:hypothetical protein
MRWLILVCLIISGCASTQKSVYVRTTGTGKNLEEARHIAFRDAIEIRVGTLILSERESTKFDLVKDQIIAHSGGYVDDYKIVHSHTNNGRVTVTVDVLVADSKITNHILSMGKSSKNIDGNKHDAQYSTLMNERKSGDRILDNVLKKYPMNAYNIKQQPYTITIDPMRNMVMNIPYEVSWNYSYIESLSEVLALLEDESPSILKKMPGNITIMVKNPKDYVIGKKSVYRFNDVSRVYKVQDAFSGKNEMRIKYSINDYGRNTMIDGCWVSGSVSGYKDSFYGVGSTNDVRIFGNTKEKNVISFVIPSNLTAIINRASTVELSVVARSDC